MQTLEQLFSVQFAYPVFFSRHVFEAKDPLLESVFAKAGGGRNKVLCVVDSGLLAANPDLPGQIERYAEMHREVMWLCDEIVVAEGGERCKAEPKIVDTLMERVARHHSFGIRMCWPSAAAPCWMPSVMPRPSRTGDCVLFACRLRFLRRMMPVSG